MKYKHIFDSEKYTAKCKRCGDTFEELMNINNLSYLHINPDGETSVEDFDVRFNEVCPCLSDEECVIKKLLE